VADTIVSASSGSPRNRTPRRAGTRRRTGRSVTLDGLRRALPAGIVCVQNAYSLHHAPNVLLIPGTADLAHLEANMAVGDLTFDDATLARLDAVESRSNEVLLG
jgi:aryl-alcohol dehydrogenase-like predicted oxidoreductase